MTSRAGRSVLPALGGLVALYLIVPLVAFAIRLATSSSTGFHTPGLWSAAAVSIVAATISLGVICLFGIPLAYVLARSKLRLAKVISLTVAVPLALPPLMGGILLVYLVGPYTALGRLFGGRLTESIAGIVLAQTFVAAPFLITVARAGFADVDASLYDVAQTLGIGPTGRFLRVAIPAARRAIRAGMVLSWLRAFGEYGATVILAYHPYSLPIFTYLQFGSAGLTHTEAPTAIAIAVALGAVLLGEIRLPRRRTHSLPVPADDLDVVHRPATISFAIDLELGAFHLNLAYASSASRIAILGPSGSGKSLTLRCLARVLAPGHSTVTIREHSDLERVIDAVRVGYVPQTLGLFPHLVVGEQLLFGRGNDPHRAALWATRLGIVDLLDRPVETLSGGERQRVSLARTFARDPDLLLFDEPFSALDAPVRSKLRLDVRSLQRATGVPSVIVTHDPEEAAMLADEIVVIADGALLQAGTVREVFDRPASPRVAGLLGVENIFPGIAGDGGNVTTCGVTVETGSHHPPGRAVTWAVRATDGVIGERGTPARVLDVIDRGSVTDALVELAPGVVLQLRCGSAAVKAGQQVAVDLPQEAVLVWAESSAGEGS